MKHLKQIFVTLIGLCALTAFNACGGGDEEGGGGGVGQQQYFIKSVIAEATQLSQRELDYLTEVCANAGTKLNAKSTEAAAIAFYNTQLPEFISFVQKHLGEIFVQSGHKASVNIQLVDQIGKVVKSTLVETDVNNLNYTKQIYSIALVITSNGNMTDEQKADLDALCKESGYSFSKALEEADAIGEYNKTIPTFRSLLQTKFNILKKAGVEGVIVEIQLVNAKGEVVKSTPVSM
ncbi:MAG: hypothetical protein K5945_00205 [Bacteroidaceae bacterium]|nr:hypothetical protein [Bacteroidaceae bacterium]